MRIEERPTALDDVVIDTFYDYRDYGLSWGEAIDQTADEVGMTYDQIESILLKNKIYEAEDKDKKKDDEKSDDKEEEKSCDKKKESEIIEIEEEVTVGDIILEKGDKIKILNEEWNDDLVISVYKEYLVNEKPSIAFTMVVDESGLHSYEVERILKKAGLR